MKTMILASALILGASVAYADGFGVNGYGEYAFEAEAFEFGLGATYEVDVFTLYADTVFTKPNDVEFDLDEVTFGVDYAIDENIGIYTEVEFDGEFDYSESRVGLNFEF